MEINSVATVFAGALLLLLTMSHATDVFDNILRMAVSIDCTRNWTSSDLQQATMVAGGLLAKIMLLPVIGLCAVSIGAGVGQMGVIFETKPLKWKLSSLNPAKGLKKILPSIEKTLKMVMALLKVTAITTIIYIELRDQTATITRLGLLPLATAMQWMLRTTFVILLKILAVFSVAAVIDYAYKRKQHYDSLMMTKQEVKDERRNSEGDPRVKGRQRRKMREITLMSIIAQVPNADVVLVNPTHVAVALSYSIGSAAPKVVAKGLRKRALKIRRIAEDSDIPVVHEARLARNLYRHVSVGACISSEFFRTVAVILARLQRSGRADYSPKSTRQEG